MIFKIMEREKIYSGHVFNIERIKTKLPDDQIKNYDLVNHAPAVTILPIDEVGNIVFVKQYRIGSLSNLLELPAGVMERDEKPEICAIREIREEIGMSASNLEYLGKFFLAPGYSTELMHVFLATGLYSSPLASDPDEYIDVKRIHKSEVIEFARSGNLIDGKSLSALFLAEPHLH